ncbi:MAG: hypothetical protein PWQ67_2529 [Clostridia bacterium]|jgi:hypothetical protein|nr:hypothetical protein [Clostridia bacterium]MDN5324075.1 hypothetical protein [Clostridia bacterium]
MQINDRGNKKWTAMMLIEHREMLAKMTDELLNDAEKPLLAEDKLEEFDMILNRAIIENKLIKFWIYKNKRIINFEGYIRKTNPVNGIIQVNTKEDGVVNVWVKSIVDMQILE